MKKELLRYQRLAGIITESKYNSMLQENEISAIGQKIENAVEDKLKAKVDGLSDQQKDQLRAELAKLGVTADSDVKDVANKLDESLLEGEGDVKSKVANILGGVGQGLIGSLLVPFLPIYIGSLDPTGIGMAGGLAIVTAVGAGLIGLAKLLDDSKSKSRMEENVLQENLWDKIKNIPKVWMAKLRGGFPAIAAMVFVDSGYPVGTWVYFYEDMYKSTGKLMRVKFKSVDYNTGDIDMSQESSTDGGNNWEVDPKGGLGMVLGFEEELTSIKDKSEEEKKQWYDKAVAGAKKQFADKYVAYSPEELRKPKI